MSWTKESVARRLTALRKGIDKSQTEIGAAIGVHQTEVSAWENDGMPRLPSPVELEKLGVLYNKRPAWLLFGEEPSDPMAAAKAIELGIKFETVEGLAHVAEAYAAAEPKDREMMTQMASKLSPAPVISIRTPAAVPVEQPTAAASPAGRTSRLTVLSFSRRELRELAIALEVRKGKTRYKKNVYKPLIELSKKIDSLIGPRAPKAPRRKRGRAKGVAVKNESSRDKT